MAVDFRTGRIVKKSCSVVIGHSKINIHFSICNDYYHGELVVPRGEARAEKCAENAAMY